MPRPPPMLAGDFTKTLFLSHYLHVVAVFQIVGGLLLVMGRLVSLGSVLLAPLIVNHSGAKHSRSNSRTMTAD